MSRLAVQLLPAKGNETSCLDGGLRFLRIPLCNISFLATSAPFSTVLSSPTPILIRHYGDDGYTERRLTEEAVNPKDAQKTGMW